MCRFIFGEATNLRWHVDDATFYPTETEDIQAKYQQLIRWMWCVMNVRVWFRNIDESVRWKCERRRGVEARGIQLILRIRIVRFSPTSHLHMVEWTNVLWPKLSRDIRPITYKYHTSLDELYNIMSLYRGLHKKINAEMQIDYQQFGVDEDETNVCASPQNCMQICLIYIYLFCLCVICSGDTIFDWNYPKYTETIFVSY